MTAGFRSNGSLQANYQLKLQNLPPDVYVKSAMLGPLDVLNQDMSVLVTNTYSLDIVLAADGGRVDGVVADEGGYPIDNAAGSSDSGGAG